MKYFRHFSNASSSLKIQRVIDEFGLEGYAHYFLLLELLNEKFDGSSTTIDLHSDEISAKVRIKFGKKLATFVQKLADFQLLSFQLSGKVYQINCPILLDLMDRDSKYNRKKRVLDDQSATLEEEEEEDKEEEGDKEEKNNKKIQKEKIVSKADEPSAQIISPPKRGTKKEPRQINEPIVILFNNLADKHQMPIVKTLNDSRIKAVKKAIKDIGDDPKTWEKVFLVAGTKGFQKGDGSSWLPSFDYVFRNANYVKFSEEDLTRRIEKNNSSGAFERMMSGCPIDEGDMFL